MRVFFKEIMHYKPRLFVSSLQYPSPINSSWSQLLWTHCPPIQSQSPLHQLLSCSWRQSTPDLLQRCTLKILLYVLFYYKYCLEIFSSIFCYKYRTIPEQYFHYMKNQKYGGKNWLDIYKCLTIKKIWGQTPISTVLIIEC